MSLLGERLSGTNGLVGGGVAPQSSCMQPVKIDERLGFDLGHACAKSPRYPFLRISILFRKVTGESQIIRADRLAECFFCHRRRAPTDLRRSQAYGVRGAMSSKVLGRCDRDAPPMKGIWEEDKKQSYPAWLDGFTSIRFSSPRVRNGSADFIVMIGRAASSWPRVQLARDRGSTTG